MTRSLVLTLLGNDRPGLVEKLSRLVGLHQGNWVESRMARLGGQFAGILRVDLPESNVPGFSAACSELRARGLVIVIASEPSGEATPFSRRLNLELVGQDRPGIVREIAQALAARQVNVEELDTGVSSAPMSGQPLFFAKAKLGVPAQVTDQDLRSALEQIGEDLMVDVILAE